MSENETSAGKRRNVRRIVQVPKPEDLKKEWAKKLREALLVNSRAIAGRLTGDMSAGAEIQTSTDKFEADLLRAYYAKQGWKVAIFGSGTAWGLRFDPVEVNLDGIDLDSLDVEEVRPAAVPKRRKAGATAAASA